MSRRPYDPMPSPRMSIVIPLHNSATHVSSFTHQFESMDYDKTLVEFIIVDDGSTDDGAKRFSDALSSLGQVKLLTIDDSSGPGAARNCGLAAAMSPYVTFWDSDDSPDLLAFLELSYKMKIQSATIGTLGYRIVDPNKQRLLELFIPNPSGADVHLLATRAAVWRFVFLSDFLREQELMFPLTNLGEDLEFLLDAMDKNKNAVTTLPISGYTYHWRAIDSLYSHATHIEYADLLLRLIEKASRYQDPVIQSTAANWAVRIWIRCSLRDRARLATNLSTLLVRVALKGHLGQTVVQLHRSNETRLTKHTAQDSQTAMGEFRP